MTFTSGLIRSLSKRIAGSSSFSNRRSQGLVESFEKMPGKFVDFVNDKVKGNKVAVFSKTYCPYCDMAKTALKDAGLKNYLLIELDKVEDGSAIQDALLEITGGRTVGFYFRLVACKTLFCCLKH